MKAKRILFMRAGALGDFILTLPAIAALRRSAPETWLELIARPEFAHLAMAAGLADAAASVDSARVAAYFQPNARLPRDEREWLSSFDLIVCCFHDPNCVVEENLTLAGVKRMLKISPLVSDRHATDHFMLPLRVLGVDVEKEKCPRLDLPAQLGALGGKILSEMLVGQKPLAIQPGSGSPKKNWPLEEFLKIAEWYERSRSGQAFFILGEAEQKAAEKLSRIAPQFPILKCRPLIEVAASLSRCACYLGNDSGITHLAAALGVPTAVLFGASDHRLWAPRGRHVSIVISPRAGEKDGMASISPKKAVESLKSLISNASASASLN